MKKKISNELGRKLIAQTVDDNFYNMFIWLIEQFNFNDALDNLLYFKALYRSIQNRNIKIFEKLLDKSVNKDPKRFVGAMQLACVIGVESIVVKLIDFGVDPLYDNSLFLKKSTGHRSIQMYLIDKGCDVGQLNYYDRKNLGYSDTY